ncbi:MAG: hypothetical protein ACJ8FY_25185 [Gemmataceae bacterium]
MELKLESGPILINPSIEEIANVLPFEGFAIISENLESMSFMQFCKSRKKGLALEYQVDSLENHFTATSVSLTMEGIVLAFQKYAQGDASWRSDFQWQQWEKINLKGRETILSPGWAEKFRKNPPRVIE